MTEASQVNLSEPIEMIRVATERCAELDGRDIPHQHKDRVKALAGIQRDTLYLAHLLDRARLLVLDEYHLLRGFTDHRPPTTERAT